MKLSEFRTLIREEVRKVLKEHYVKDIDTIGQVMKSGDWFWASAKKLNGPNLKRLNMASKFAPIQKALLPFTNTTVQDFFTWREYDSLEDCQEQIEDSTDDAYAIDEFNEIYEVVAKAIKRNQKLRK